MSNPRRPVQLKALAGTLRPCRDAGRTTVALPLVDGEPPPPAWLPNAYARAEWKRLTQLLRATGMLTVPGLGGLAVLCAVHGQIVARYAAGSTPLGNMLALHRVLSGDFGLKAGPGLRPSSGPAANRFEERGKRPGGES